MNQKYSEMKNYSLPDDLLLGAATASVQIEGGDTNNSWYAWCEAGKVPNGDHCIVANDHWNRVAEDVDLMKSIGIQTYRMSIEWARIEPTKGKYDSDALQHYRKEIETLLANNILPLVTLHHFSNPIWLENDRGWLNPEIVKYFVNYTNFVVTNLGDLVREWATINEPNVYLYNGYMDGLFPPGIKGKMKDYFAGAKQMCLAHCSAYQTIHAISKQQGWEGVKVGAAVHVRVFDMVKGSRLERLAQHLHYRLFQEMFLDAMIGGKFDKFIGGGFPMGQGVFADFVGLNYYTRDVLKGSFNPLSMFATRTIPNESKINDLGWEIYPEGLFRLCQRYFNKYKLPIYITENGTADANDYFRKEYLQTHLEQLMLLRQANVPVLRYYHWTLMDNFEWMEGYEARFGLFEHNLETQQRTLRESGKFYGEVCSSRQFRC